MKITANRKVPITAADDDIWGDSDTGDVELTDEEVLEDDEDAADAIDDLSDDVEDIQDQLDDITEDDPTIEIDNNIADHYIAECDRCHGIFISAVIKSDQDVKKISGICPLCEHESDQILKWIVTEVQDR